MAEALVSWQPPAGPPPSAARATSPPPPPAAAPATTPAATPFAAPEPRFAAETDIAPPAAPPPPAAAAPGATPADTQTTPPPPPATAPPPPPPAAAPGAAAAPRRCPVATTPLPPAPSRYEAFEELFPFPVGDDGLPDFEGTDLSHEEQCLRSVDALLESTSNDAYRVRFLEEFRFRLAEGFTSFPTLDELHYALFEEWALVVRHSPWIAPHLALAGGGGRKGKRGGGGGAPRRKRDRTVCCHFVKSTETRPLLEAECRKEGIDYTAKTTRLGLAAVWKSTSELGRRGQS